MIIFKGKKKTLKRLTVVFLIISIITMSNLNYQSASATNSVTLSVDTNMVIQDNYLGTGAVYHGFAYMPESISKGYDSTLQEVEFGRISDMELNLARTWYRPDWACGQAGYSGYDWNSTKMTAFYNWLDEMQNTGVDVAINSGWFFTTDIYNVWPIGSGDASDWSTMLEQWAEWMSESLYQLITVRGYTNVKYVMLFTEPNNNIGVVPTGYTHYMCYKEAIIALHNKLTTDGRRNLVKLVGPNYAGFEDVSTVVADLDDYIDIYTAHGYDETDYNGWFNKANSIASQITSTGKPYWIDEYGKTDKLYRNSADYGNYLGQAIAAFLNAGAQSSQIWLLFNQQYTWPINTVTNGDSFVNGVHKWGTAEFLPDSQLPHPSYYAFSLISKYMGGSGTEVYSTTNSSDVYISATKQTSGGWSFLVVNGNDEEQDITVNLSGSINKSLYRYLYDPAQVPLDTDATMIGYDKVIGSVTNSFSDSIPAKAVVIYSSVQGEQANATYEENFSDGYSQGWIATSGTWAVENEEYSGENDALSYYSALEFDDFTYSFKGMFIGSNFGDMRAIFRIQDSTNFYQAYISKASGYQYLRLYKVVNGTATQIGSEIEYDPPVNTELDWVITCDGNEIIISVDGNTVYAVDSTFSSGKIGLRSKNCHAHFDDIVVGKAVKANSYSVDFDDGISTGWEQKSGTWAVENGEYSGVAGSTAGTTFYELLDYDNFTCSFISRFVGTTSGDARAIFRVQDENNYYMAYISKYTGYQYLRLYKVVDGTVTQIGSEVAYNPPIDTDLQWTITCDGSSIIANVADNTVTATDSTFTIGKIGFMIKNSHVHFDDVEVAVMYEEDFNDDLAQNWIPVCGAWETEGGGYIGTDNLSYGFSYYNAVEFEDFTYSFTSEIADGTIGDIHIVFRYQDLDNYYMAYVSKADGYQYLRLYKIVDGSATQIGTQIAYNPSTDTEISCSITCDGSSLSATIGGNTVTATDSTFTKGKIGLKVKNCEVCFDDVEVH